MLMLYALVQVHASPEHAAPDALANLTAIQHSELV